MNEAEAASRWQAQRDELDAAAQGTKESPFVPLELSRRYTALTDEERRGADRVIAEWVVADDETLSFDAMSLINKHGIASAVPALRLLAARLSGERGPQPANELKKVRRLIDRLTTGGP